MRQQARSILSTLGRDSNWVEELLKTPPVVMFSGHMVDRTGRQEARFDAKREADVARRLADLIDRVDPLCGYSSAACGGDILFLEAMLERGRDVHVVLPLPSESFVSTSVDPGGEGWRERFDRVLREAASVTVSSASHSRTEPAYAYANLILHGMAELHAERIESDLVGLAVWDGKPGRRAASTGSAVAHWASRGVRHSWIAPATAEEGSDATPLLGGGAQQRLVAIEDPRLAAMMFADAVGYSRLADTQIPLFFEHVMRAAADLVGELSDPPLFKDTAGDSVYLLFRDVHTAAAFALDFRDRVARTDWSKRGLARDLSFRIGLHCGPVHRVVDPITGRETYAGAHANQAARIEPITPPGEVYCSHAFAAVAAAQGPGPARFEYVGRTMLAKRAGPLGLYHVRRP